MSPAIEASVTPKSLLLEQLREGDHFSPSKLMALLHLDAGSFAAQAKVHPSTVIKAPHSPAVQNRLRDIAGVLVAMQDVTGDLDRTIFWFKNEPLPEFGYKTAEEVVAAGNTESVLRLVGLHQAGFAG